MANDILAGIENGELVNGTSVSTNKKKVADNTLGKEAFLRLLVTQLEYQDPLNPSSDTEFVAQLAQFSALEQMQNLSQTSLNSQAFSLVGKEVIIKSKSPTTGEINYIQGSVDYVTIKNGEANLFVNDKLYSIEDLYTVIGDDFVISQLVPSVEETKATYDHDNPEDVEVKISLGSEAYEAGSVAVFINGNVVDSKHLSYDKETGKLTISKDAFTGLDAGTYKLGFMFDDPLYTTVTDKVSLTVTGTKPPSDDKEDSDGSGDSDSSGDKDDKEDKK